MKEAGDALRILYNEGDKLDRALLELVLKTQIRGDETFAREIASLKRAKRISCDICPELDLEALHSLRSVCDEEELLYWGRLSLAVSELANPAVVLEFGSLMRRRVSH